MARSTRSLPALGALIMCGGVITACAQSVPSGDIATVASVNVSKASFNHWLSVAVKSSAAQTPGAGAGPLDPPNFTACVAYHQTKDPKPPKGQPNPTPESLKTGCQMLYNSARDQVVPFLITADWLQGEAVDQGVKVSDAEVATGLKRAEAQQSPAQLAQFLATSGETTADLLFRVRIDTISNKIRQKVTGVKTVVTPADIAAYYNKNASQFSKPETRDLRIALLKTPASAKHVRALLDSGQSFSKVAKQYSLDMATKAKGGALIGVQRGQQDPALDAAIFGAKIGQLVGPVKTSFGYEIFRIQKITPTSKRTLAQETPLIRMAITQQRQQAALTAFVKHFEAKWRSRTMCAKGYVVADCKNGPKPSTTAPPGPATRGATTGR